MSRMSIPELMKVFDNIPRRDEMTVALAFTKPIQNRGRREYDVIVAGKALVAHYRRMAKSDMIRYESRKASGSTHSLEIAKRLEARANTIENKLKELMEHENHQGIVQR